MSYREPDPAVLAAELREHRALVRAHAARKSTREPCRNRSVRLRVDQCEALSAMARRTGSTASHLIRIAVDAFIGGKGGPEC